MGWRWGASNIGSVIWGVYMHRVSQVRSGQVLEVSGYQESGRVWLHPC